MTNERAKRLIIEAVENGGTIFDSYDASKEDTVILEYCGDETDANIYITCKVLDSGILVNIGCYDFPNFSHNRMAGYAVCNQFNCDTLTRFYIDEEGDAVAQTTVLFDAYGIESGFSGEAVLIAAMTMATEIDDAYVAFNNAL